MYIDRSVAFHMSFKNVVGHAVYQMYSVDVASGVRNLVDTREIIDTNGDVEYVYDVPTLATFGSSFVVFTLECESAVGACSATVSQASKTDNPTGAPTSVPTSKPTSSPTQSPTTGAAGRDLWKSRYNAEVTKYNQCVAQLETAKTFFRDKAPLMTQAMGLLTTVNQSLHSLVPFALEH